MRVIGGEKPPYNPEWHELLYLSEEEYFAARYEFPFSAFAVEGFLVLQVEDVSQQAAINKLHATIINMHTIPMDETWSKIQHAMGELLNDADLQIGITPFFKVNDEVVYDETFNTKSI